MQEVENWRRWFDRKELTTNWLGSEINHWFPSLAHLKNLDCQILEVGSYEGRSAIAFLEYLPRCHLTAIDIFVDPEVERRFDRNMAPYGDRVTKIKNRGLAAMDAMYRKRQFDAIYLDTGKRRELTFANAAIAWSLLSEGGVLIFDDLAWGEGNASKDRPHDAIWLFCLAFESCIEYLHEGKQMIVKKVAEWPAMPGVEKISTRHRSSTPTGGHD